MENIFAYHISYVTFCVPYDSIKSRFSPILTILTVLLSWVVMKGLTLTEVCCDDWPVSGHWDHPPTSDWSNSTVYYYKISSTIIFYFNWTHIYRNTRNCVDQTLKKSDVSKCDISHKQLPFHEISLKDWDLVAINISIEGRSPPDIGHQW